MQANLIINRDVMSSGCRENIKNFDPHTLVSSIFTVAVGDTVRIMLLEQLFRVQPNFQKYFKSPCANIQWNDLNLHVFIVDFWIEAGVEWWNHVDALVRRYNSATLFLPGSLVCSHLTYYSRHDGFSMKPVRKMQNLSSQVNGREVQNRLNLDERKGFWRPTKMAKAQSNLVKYYVKWRCSRDSRVLGMKATHLQTSYTCISR